MLFLAPRKHLFATNLIMLLVIYIMRKCLQLFCIIENKTGADGQLQPEMEQEKNWSEDSPLLERRRGGFKIIPDAIHKSMHGFGYGEGHYQIFVEKKERNLPTKSRLNAATAEVKLNPN
ncbi:uncharacterized protein Dwil_GK12533 [Drosophila willistoni]|uniref:Uncharacterized protein n=1 Tax=Drosophila willistoni TaxID=7260 RepID=B4N309_DROWI|nr:uncharacterized protein LOC6644996 [Drosophila willistoni]EDW78748.1 uncharacterized protein Dwil_GK12533 [Drosophila willistoni]